MTKKWIKEAINPKNKGELRHELHVKKGQDIPLKKLQQAAESKNPTLRKEANMAKTLRKMHHKH